MKTNEIKEILSWVRTTDLTTVSLKESNSGFSFSTMGAEEENDIPSSPSLYQCISAPAIGVFQWSAPGRQQKIQEGSLVASGTEIGFIETAPGKTTPVISPISGTVARILIEGSTPVGYGQAILFITPDGK